MLLSWSLVGQNLGGIRGSVGACGAICVGCDGASALVWPEKEAWNRLATDAWPNVVEEFKYVEEC